MDKLRITLVAALALCTAAITNAGVNESATTQALSAYVPANSGFVKPKVEKVTINDAKRTISVKCNESTAYLSLTADNVNRLKEDMLASLPAKYAKYKLDIIVGKTPISKLVRNEHKVVGPTEKNRFVTPLESQPAPKGLEGSNIALWQSHGWYFEPKLNRWEWQRARIFETVEDLYTQGYVMPFLMPMLENAGAYVMSPRERDVRSQEYIIDNDAVDSGYKETNGTHAWGKAPKAGFAYDGAPLKDTFNPFRAGTARVVESQSQSTGQSVASWNADIADDGTYAVYVSYQSLPTSAPDAIYTINAADGSHQVMVNQQMGGGTWIYLGHYPLNKGLSELPIVQLSNASAKVGSKITADAVKIGGGMGNVARKVKEPLDDIDYQYTLSGYPRFTEGARYWLQWAGAPDSVYTPSGNVNDYTDDYRCRGLWVNWLAGGSSMLPKEEGLGIPVDLSLAFHTDAGTTMNDSIIGTLGIYFTDANKETYKNGTSRWASRDYCDLVMTNICDDVRATFEPSWSRRGMWDKSYFEARVPEVPAMLLELLSHQNFADMKSGLDPAFRFVVSRAIYKGMLEFIANRDGYEFVVQPLPVKAMAINGGQQGKYKLTWQETVDKLEPTATPTYYIVEERVGDALGFTQIAKVEKPEYEIAIIDSEIHSYRVIAGNDGGISFPSEVLALRYLPGSKQAMIVNGFTRVSAPDWFEAGEIAGFYNDRDNGVPYLQDISFIGEQMEFRREIPWMDDDASGFGSSRSNYETQTIAGNTFDYVALHGQSMVEAGYGFISMSVEAFMNSDESDQPKIVDLILGKQKEVKRGTGAYGTNFKTYPAPLQDKLRRYTKAGGSVMVSGSFIATDLWDNPNSSAEVAARDKAFASEVLGYTWRAGQASLTGEAYEVSSRFRSFDGGDFAFYNDLNPEFYAVESPDSFYATDSKKGATIMRYSENNLVAATAFDAGTYRTVAIGFPFETIKDKSQRDKLMQQILSFLNK